MRLTRHFTATTYVVHKEKALLHLHKKLGLWLPVGGHIEDDELPEDAAVREVKEETGLTVALYRPDPDWDMGEVRQLVRPMHVLLENVFENSDQFHQHIDLIYYATSGSYEILPVDGEKSTMKWFDRGELDVFHEAPVGVRKIAQEALNILVI